MTKITDILPRYTQLNAIVVEVSNKHSIEFAQQQFVVDFYTQFSNIQLFETMLIELTMQFHFLLLNLQSTNIRVSK